MPNYTIAAYNIEHMNRMFENNTIKASQVNRANDIAAVISRINPHVLAISEAANDPAEHQHFIDNYLGGNYQVVNGTSRGAQNLVFYIRAPFQLVSVDEAINFYEPWNVDIDDDGVKERLKWERKPLEAVFSIGAGNGAQRIRFILVHAKSKGVFDVVDLARFQILSQGSRKKLIGQAVRLRERIDDLLNQNNPLPLVVLGDMNDGPGLDPHERVLGKSFVETVMGSVFNPSQVLHNPLIEIPVKERYTADFPDPIVSNPRGFNHRVWIDHILLSPDLKQANSPLRFVDGSGTIDAHDSIARKASDHFAVLSVLTDD